MSTKPPKRSGAHLRTHLGVKRAGGGPRPKPRRVKSLQRFLRAYGPGAEGARLRHAFAKRMDTSLPYLIALAWGYRSASVGMAVKIEHATHGLVTREDLRPEEDWAALAPREEHGSEPQSAAAA